VPSFWEGMALVEHSRQRAACIDARYAETALALFDFSQQAAEKWQPSDFSTRRQILDCVSSDRALSDVSLVLTKRKPFDVLAQGLL